MKSILSIKNLTVEFGINRMKLIAVNDVSFSLYNNEILGLVGESGCGKTMTTLAIMKLVPFPGRISKGEVYFEGVNIMSLREKEMNSIRGKKIAMIFQDPNTTLNPSFRIGWQISEVLKTKSNYINSVSHQKIINMLDKVDIPDPSKRILQYPHQLSGGMKQRVVISMALLINPKLIIADEPTTALDVTTQKEIFDLIESLRKNIGLSFLVISHDLYLMAERCDRIIVMYAGQIVEIGKSNEIFYKPLHPYTKALINSIPKLDGEQKRLGVISGEVLDLINLPENKCLFEPRCNLAKKICRNKKPELMEINGRFVRCHFLK